MDIQKEPSCSIEERLKARIKEAGPITYEAYVEAVLYDEREGYYRSGKQYGKDYYTSPEIHALFGKTIGRYIEDVGELLQAPSVTVLELGGASAKLATDIISSFTRLSLDSYFIFEKGEERRQDKIEWINSLRSIEPLTPFTVIIANEFFDALPFHKVVRLNGRLQEIYVGYEEGFLEQAGPLSSEVAVFLEGFPMDLQEKQTLEVATFMARLIDELSELIAGRGILLVFDYGYHQDDIKAGRFFDGSAVGYKSWKMCEDVFKDMGRMDVTHHVNFDHLSALLMRDGWKQEGEIEQYRFLFNIGILQGFGGLPPEERMSAKWLIHPEGLGSMISVVGFSKHLPLSLPGFTRAW